jgi:hypothetical protein
MAGQVGVAKNRVNLTGQKTRPASYPNVMQGELNCMNKIVLFFDKKTGGIVMKKIIIFCLLCLVFITVTTASNIFALKNVQLHRNDITSDESDDSVDEESMLEEEQELLEKNGQNENNVDPDKMIINPDETKNKIDPGIILGVPNGFENTMNQNPETKRRARQVTRTLACYN